MAATTTAAETSTLPPPSRRPSTPLAPAASVTASSSKAQSQCLQLCKNIAAAGDRVAERMAKYSAMVKHLPHGFDTLANELLDTCQVLFYIEAGLEEAVRSNYPLPLEMVTVLEKRLRAAQADFRVLDQMVAKFVDYDRSAMGRMRRGFGKVFGDNGIDKATTALQRRREDMRMSALMFQWNLGSDKIESRLGIGYIGLAAALDGTNLRRKRNASVASDDKGASFRSPAPQPRGLDGRLAGPGSVSVSASMSSAPGQPLPMLLPSREALAAGASSFSPGSLSGESSLGTFAPTASELGQDSPTTRYTVSSTASSYDGAPPSSASPAATGSAPSTRAPRTGRAAATSSTGSSLTWPASTSTRPASSTSRAICWPCRGGARAWPSTPTRPARATPSSRPSAGATTSSSLQLLDRGVSPNTGPDAHALNEALAAGDGESVRLLLLFGADANDADRDAVSPLVTAVDKAFLPGAAADVRLLHLLLMYGGSANQATADGNTLLIAAINRKTPWTVVDLLLGYGADPNDKNGEGKTALFEAIQCARPDVVSSLLDNGANANLPGHVAARLPAAAAGLRRRLQEGAQHPGAGRQHQQRRVHRHPAQGRRRPQRQGRRVHAAVHLDPRKPRHLPAAADQRRRPQPAGQRVPGLQVRHAPP